MVFFFKNRETAKPELYLQKSPNHPGKAAIYFTSTPDFAIKQQKEEEEKEPQNILVFKDHAPS